MKKILITGCSGLLGTYLIKKFLVPQEPGNYFIVGVDINDPKIETKDKNFKFEKLDLTKDESIKYLFSTYKFDLVINAFGIKGSPIRAKEKPVDFLYPSLKINTEIINQCHKNDIWLVFVSSVGVYSPAEKFVEDDVWKTLPSENDWYPSWSKRTGELLLEAYKVQYGYDKWSIIRPANIFGDYDDFSGNGTVISSTIKKIWESEGKLECWGDGSPTRDFVYGKDVAEAIFKMYNNKINDIVNFGSGEEITIKSMVEDLISISKKNIKVTWDTTKPNGDLRRQMDITKQKKYDLLPTTPFKRALERTYYYYISQFRTEIFNTRELYDKGFYVGNINEIFDNIEELDQKIEELKSYSLTKDHYSARFDYNLSEGETKYKISINEEEYAEREKYVKENNRITVQKWWESTSPIFNGLKSYFDEKVDKYITKVYPESEGVISNGTNFTLYENGDFITPHRDGFNKSRYCVILIYLSDEKDYNDGGGELVIMENGVEVVVPPVKGNFAILDFTRNNPNHAVNVVKNDFIRYTYINFIQNRIIHNEEMEEMNKNNKQ
jgi:GDP-L-fucose synthase